MHSKYFLVIPRKLRQRILQLAHESHQGVLKTKQLLREKVWWSRMDTATGLKVLLA
jgi:hypothetical protein